VINERQPLLKGWAHGGAIFVIRYCAVMVRKILILLALLRGGVPTHLNRACIAPTGSNVFTCFTGGAFLFLESKNYNYLSQA
jgi:hypothetical protein